MRPRTVPDRWEDREKLRQGKGCMSDWKAWFDSPSQYISNIAYMSMWPIFISSQNYS